MQGCSGAVGGGGAEPGQVRAVHGLVSLTTYLPQAYQAEAWLQQLHRRVFLCVQACARSLAGGGHDIDDPWRRRCGGGGGGGLVAHHTHTHLPVTQG